MGQPAPSISLLREISKVIIIVFFAMQSVSAMSLVLVVMLAVKKRNAVGRHSQEQPFFSDCCSKERLHGTKERPTM
jgi:hypothetical protein